MAVGLECPGGGPGPCPCWKELWDGALGSGRALGCPQILLWLLEIHYQLAAGTSVALCSVDPSQERVLFRKVFFGDR